MNKKSMRKAATPGGALFSAVIALALTTCFNPPAPIGDHNGTDGDSFVDVQIGIGGGANRSLSLKLAEQYLNYMEIIFVVTKGTGVVDNNSDFYRLTGYSKLLWNYKLKMTVPAGLYDNADGVGHNKAIMLAGVRDLYTGECTLLATGVIGTVYEGSTEFNTPNITDKTTGVSFKLTALTAAISPSIDSAFTVDPPNFGTTKIAGVSHPYFGIQAATIKDDGTIDEATTDAHFTLTGWGADTGKGENNTQRFIHLVHEYGEEFGLPGIGRKTGEGDKPLSSRADVSWKLTNTSGVMTGDNTSINITFTSKSTVAYSGMGWLPVCVPVRAFALQAQANTQVWLAGSGILQNQLDAGADTEGAGIVILHGKKLFETEVGPGYNGESK